MSDLGPIDPPFAGKLHYRGNLLGRIEGQVLGPSEAGEWFTIGGASYDEDTGMTTAWCRYATVDEVRERNG